MQAILWSAYNLIFNSKKKCNPFERVFFFFFLLLLKFAVCVCVRVFVRNDHFKLITCIFF